MKQRHVWLAVGLLVVSLISIAVVKPVLRHFVDWFEPPIIREIYAQPLADVSENSPLATKIVGKYIVKGSSREACLSFLAKNGFEVTEVKKEHIESIRKKGRSLDSALNARQNLHLYSIPPACYRWLSIGLGFGKDRLVYVSAGVDSGCI